MDITTIVRTANVNLVQIGCVAALGGAAVAAGAFTGLSITGGLVFGAYVGALGQPLSWLAEKAAAKLLTPLLTDQGHLRHIQLKTITLLFFTVIALGIAGSLATLSAAALGFPVALTAIAIFKVIAFSIAAGLFVNADYLYDSVHLGALCTMWLSSSNPLSSRARSG